MKRFLPLLAILCFLGAGKDQYSILTGHGHGNYYKAAYELNSVLGSPKLDIKKTDGSFYNIIQLGRGIADLGIAQFDAIKFLSRKLGDRFISSCKVLVPLNFEYIHIVINKSSKIRTFSDLKGKRIGVGKVNSGTWISAYILMKNLNQTSIENNNSILEIPYSDMLQKLLTNDLDAFFVTSQAGMPFLKNLKANLSGKIELLNLGKDFPLERSMRRYYLIFKIPSGTYPWQTGEVYTVATPSYILINKRISKDSVYNLSQKIFESASYLQRKSNLWRYLNPRRVKMEIKANIPYHKGVIEFIKKQGN